MKEGTPIGFHSASLSDIRSTFRREKQLFRNWSGMEKEKDMFVSTNNLQRHAICEHATPQASAAAAVSYLK